MTNTKSESPYDDIRGNVRARITPGIVANLAEEFSISTDKGVLRERIVHTLTRYERGMISDSKPTKKELRKQLRYAVNSTTKLHQILSDNESQVREYLLYQLEYDTYAEWLETVDLWTSDSPPQVLNLADTTLLVERLKHASERLLSELESTAELKRSNPTEPLTGIARTPLDQLITDIQGTLVYHLDDNRNVTCYFDAVNDQYRGVLYEFAKSLLDAYGSGHYFSDNALGQRIVRVLKKDKMG